MVAVLLRTVVLVEIGRPVDVQAQLGMVIVAISWTVYTESSPRVVVGQSVVDLSHTMIRGYAHILAELLRVLTR